MTKMYNKRTIMGLMAMAAAFDGFGGNSSRAIRESKPTPKKSIQEINKKQGLKEFTYGENKIWALNKKNADKKAIKLGWIELIKVDVPNGWLYGFPKDCPSEIISNKEEFELWLIKNGYPKKLITKDFIYRTIN